MAATTSDAERASRLETVLSLIDAANADDPTRVRFEGRDHPKEPLHAELMTRWLNELDPEADELALIAARGHHLRRWTFPRSAYPLGRRGYLAWRAAAQARHADEVGALMAECGYGDDEIDRVRSIICKERLRSDPVVQTHQDARCLVFLQTQLDSVADQLGEDATIEVLRRTLPKMTARGIAVAASLDLGPRGAALLAAASGESAGDDFGEHPLR